MPHVIVKLYSGRTDTDKGALAERITKAVMDTLGYGEEAVSVAVEDIDPKDWAEKVYKPEIEASPRQLYKKPGYKPSDL